MYILMKHVAFSCFSYHFENKTYLRLYFSVMLNNVECAFAVALKSYNI